MNFFSRYTEYLKHIPEGYWFKRKAYGWGWVPATWQGGLTLFVFLGVFVSIFVPFVSNVPPSDSEVIWFLIKILAWVAALILVCFITGEPPKWQWGIPDNEREDR